ncbi:T9SS type A sorting domain-containing protein [candidate division KSB1 bacterium]|nr:T9SS type A sorting domain-containing protein [candidate division KSB1 bacterium]
MVLASVTTPGKAAEIAMQGDKVYIADGNRGVYIYDITNPAEPFEFLHVAGVWTTYSVQVRGNLLFVCDGANGFFVFDISDPANPVKIGYFDTGFYVENMTMDESYIYLTDNDNGIYIIELNDPTFISAGITGKVPSAFSLDQNYPNPFNAATKFTFYLPRSTRVRVDVFNLSGQKVRTLIDENISAGVESVTWDGRDNYGRLVPSGVYFYQMDAGGIQQVKKCMLLR